MENKSTTYIKCNLCGNDSTVIHFRVPVKRNHKGVYVQDEWDIVRCKICGLIYVNPRMSDELIQEYYKFDNTGDKTFVNDWFIENADLQKPTWIRFLRILYQYKSGGKLIDIGCGAGSFLDLAKKAGYRVEGQEISPYFAEYCQTHLEIPFHFGELHEIDLPPHHYDVVTAFDVIEHHQDPAMMLNYIHKILKPGGILMISTHNIGNVFARLYGPNWRHVNPIGHLTYFNKATLVKLLKKTHFEIRSSGGLHTFDSTTARIYKNWFQQLFKTILLRGLILGFYRPVSKWFPIMTRWELKIGDKVFNHKKLLLRAGPQIIINDDVVVIAQTQDFKTVS